MKKISVGQMTALLVLSRMFAEATRFPLTVSDYNMQRFTAILIAKIMLVLMYIPIILFMRKNEGESVISFAVKKSRGLGITVGIIFIVFILFTETLTTCKLQFYASSTIFSQASTLLMIILLELVCGYGVYKGLQAVARVSTVALVILFVFIGLVGIAVWKYADFTFLYPAFVEEGGSFIHEIVSEISRNSEILIIPILMSEVRGKPQKVIYRYIPIIWLLIELMHFLSTVVLGPYLYQVDFPFYILSALSDIALFQRLDGIDVAIWIMGCIIKRALFTLCVKYIADRIFSPKVGTVTALASLAAVGGIAIAVSGNHDILEVLKTVNSTTLPQLICGVAIPLILLPMKKVKGGEQAEQA